MIVFENLYPGLILLISSIILAIVFKIFGVRRIYGRIYRVSHPLIDYIKTEKRRLDYREVFADVLALTVIVLLSISFMDPYYTYTVKEVVGGRGLGEIYLKARPAVILILDVSGSMRGEKIETAKRALMEFIDLVNGSLDIGFIAFNHQIVYSIPPTGNYTIVYRRIKGLEASGGTMYSYPLEAAYEYLKIYRDFDLPASVVFASDGLPADRDRAFKIIDKYAEEKIVVYGVFIGGNSEGYKLIEEMSSRTGGKAFKADEVSKLVSIYRDIAYTIKNTTRINTTVSLRFERTVERRISIGSYFTASALIVLVAAMIYTYRLYRFTF